MATKTSHLLRPLVAGVALVAAMAALLIAYSASPAHAALDSCTTIGETTTCTYVPSGSEDTFEVPEGVSTIHVVATGAPGAVGFFGGSAGRGATVSGDLTVTPGQLLYVNVGGTPTGDPTGTICRQNVACVGGFNGGGSSSSTSSGFGGGGGGASDVRTVATPSSGDQSASLNSRLIVAGGGGGSGSGRGCSIEAPPLPGGTGGDAGSGGGDGTPCSPDAPGTGGEAGSQSAGGSGGSPDGHSGSLGLGGNGGGNFGGSGFGGGGGGGYYGGGGGGDINGDSPAGGGGGGSNLVPTGGSATIATTTGSSIIISYTVPKPVPTTKDQCKKGGWSKFGYPDQGTCITFVNQNRP
jgi:Glycine rich protein